MSTADKMIRVSNRTKNVLKKMRKYPRETYEDVIKRIIKELTSIS